MYLIFFYFRERLKRNYTLGEYYLEIEYNDLKMFDEGAAIKVKSQPTTFLPVVIFETF